MEWLPLFRGIEPRRFRQTRRFQLNPARVINTGMMEPTFMTGDYPEGKIVVFLASPTDFRYAEMKRDRSFLGQHHWRIHWIEFAGGHTMAPATVYEQGAEWLDENLR